MAPTDLSAASVDDDTVAAIVTPLVHQAGGVAIVRLSGSEAVAIARQLFEPGSPAATRPLRRPWAVESHRVEYGCVYDSSGSLVDEARLLRCLICSIRLLRRRCCCCRC